MGAFRSFVISGGVWSERRRSSRNTFCRKAPHPGRRDAQGIGGTVALPAANWTSEAGATLGRPRTGHLFAGAADELAEVPLDADASPRGG